MEMSEKEKKFIEKWGKAYKNRYLSYGGILFVLIMGGILIIKGFIEKDKICFLFGYFLVILSAVSAMSAREIFRLYSILRRS